MFLRQIDELESFFKWLDRLNLIAFNVWNDKQADAFKNGSMLQMQTLYRTYISDMRQISNELALLQRQINEEKEEIRQLENEILELQRQPEIEGCYSAYYVDKHGNQISVWFAVSPDELSQYGSDSTGVHLSNRL